MAWKINFKKWRKFDIYFRKIIIKIIKLKIRKKMSIYQDYIKQSTIEVTPKGAEKVADFREFLPQGSRVFITFLPGSDIEETINCAIRLRAEGMEPLPHLAARSIPNRQFLENALKKLQAKAQIKQCLLIGGGVKDPLGDFHATSQILATGLFQDHGFEHIFVAGHPEGSPDFPDKDHWIALEEKQKFMEKTKITLEITTQFCFTAEPVFAYAKKLRDNGITMQLRVGIPGLATIKTLMMHATHCGIGPSMKVIAQQAANITKLLTVRDPSDLCHEIIDNSDKNPNISGFHLYPLGGFAKTAEWAYKS